jgi:hypothetical protein
MWIFLVFISTMLIFFVFMCCRKHFENLVIKITTFVDCKTLRLSLVQYIKIIFQKWRKKDDKTTVGIQSNENKIHMNENFEKKIVLNNKNFILKEFHNKNCCNSTAEEYKEAEKNDCASDFERKILYFKTLNELNQKIVSNFYTKSGSNIFPHPIPNKKNVGYKR